MYLPCCRTGGHLVWPPYLCNLRSCVNSVTDVCNRGDTVQYHGGLRSRELGQVPMLLVFLTPIQALSSHPHQQMVWLFWLQDRDCMPNYKMGWIPFWINKIFAGKKLQGGTFIQGSYDFTKYFNPIVNMVDLHSAENCMYCIIIRGFSV